MNAFQSCKNISDAVPLYLPQQLYLKPIARMNISVQLPQHKIMGKTISNWELMEKLRSLISPDEFTLVKETKSNLEFIRFEAEVEDKNKLDRIITKLDNKMIKLKDISEWLRVRAAVYKQNFPNRHSWDSYFREAKNMDEMKPGERPDTIHISHLPIKWFVPYHLSNEEVVKPSEKIFYRVFEKFGNLRYVDIPICDPYRNKMKLHMSGMQTFSFDEHDFFEGYVQFKDYIGFTKAMSALRGMKLLRKEEGDNICVNITIDFDKTKHLSDASIRRREIVRERLVVKQKNLEEKEQMKIDEQKRKEQAERQKEIDMKTEKEKRRREREEKRKAKILSKLKVKGADEINEKIAKEEKKLLRVQRKLEAIRLVEALFKRINEKKEMDMTESCKKIQNTSELARFKSSSEIEVRAQREKLHRAIAGRVMLKTILAGSRRIRNDSSSSSDTSVENGVDKSKKRNNLTENDAYDMHAPNWYNFPVPNGNFQYMGSFYPYMRGHGSDCYHFPLRRRGAGKEMAGPSRSTGFPRRGRGYNSRGRFRNRNTVRYPPELAQEYYKYFYKFLQEENNYNDHDNRRSRSCSYSRRPRSSSSGRSYSRSRSRSRTSRRKSRTRSRENSRRSRSRSRSKSYSRERSRRSESRWSHSHTPPRNRSNKRSRSRSEKRSRNLSTRRSRSRSERRLGKRSESRSERSRIRSERRSRSRSERRSRSRSSKRSRSRSSKRSRSRSQNRNSPDKIAEIRPESPGNKSVDSSTFISPSRLIRQHSKSKSPVERK